MPMYIPSPPTNGFHVGPAFIHVYGLMYVVGITLAILITQRRWKAVGGEPGLVGDVALWAVPAGIIGGRIYFDLTTPKYIPHHWYGVFAVWDGGLGIWGGIALGALVGVWRLRRHGADAALFADAVAPALLVAQAIGRIGNYFNKELFGGPTTLPWGLEIPLAYRPPGYAAYSTFHPTFLYELIWDLALAAFLVWLGHHRSIKPPGLFALYVTGYSAFRIFEESLRVDPSEHFLGLRFNILGDHPDHRWRRVVLVHAAANTSPGRPGRRRGRRGRGYGHRRHRHGIRARGRLPALTFTAVMACGRTGGGQGPRAHRGRPGHAPGRPTVIICPRSRLSAHRAIPG
jgi:prolipoprotein diacylglyceryl transferase